MWISNLRIYEISPNSPKKCLHSFPERHGIDTSFFDIGKAIIADHSVIDGAIAADLLDKRGDRFPEEMNTVILVVYFFNTQRF